jgi:hypothetical protein
MVAVLEECTTEEHYSVVLYFCGQKGSMQRIITKKCFLFTVRSVFSLGGKSLLMTKSFKGRCGSG